MIRGFAAILLLSFLGGCITTKQACENKLGFAYALGLAEGRKECGGRLRTGSFEEARRNRFHDAAACSASRTSQWQTTSCK